MGHFCERQHLQNSFKFAVTENILLKPEQHLDIGRHLLQWEAFWTFKLRDIVTVELNAAILLSFRLVCCQFLCGARKCVVFASVPFTFAL